MFTLEEFVWESNRIEGINRDPTPQEMLAHEAILTRGKITVEDLEAFVLVIQPGVPCMEGSPLRRCKGMNVRVGDHYPPPGGPEVGRRLHDLVYWANFGVDPTRDAHELHLQYETLHPFMDGNGRSGRAVWLWMMGGIESAPLGFLHQFYYDTLRSLSCQ